MTPTSPRSGTPIVKLINIILNCYHRICTFPDHEEILPTIYTEIGQLIAGLIASIPFVLSADVHKFFQDLATETLLVPGRPVGGLLLTHALYVISMMHIVEPKGKLYFRNCMAYIGENMRIAQAVILSKCETNDLFDYVTEAHVLLWAGMLI